MFEFSPKQFAHAEDLQMATALGLIGFPETPGLYNTHRTMRGYAVTFGYQNSTEVFTSEFLTGKRALDLGSGYGGLATDAVLRRVDSEIHSVNPHYGSEFVMVKLREVLESRLQTFEHWTEEMIAHQSDRITSALEVMYSRAHTALGHRLHFPDRYFDTVFDHYAVAFAANMSDDHPLGYHLLLLTLREVARVLKPEGHYLAGPFTHPGLEISNQTLIEEFCRSTGLMTIEKRLGSSHGAFILKRR